MSGGVDSSVTALLLKQAGHEVIGAFMKNWEEDDNDTHCSASADIADAQAICDKLEIPFKKINFASEYWDNVFEYFLQEYQAGRTPNPDILCNTEIKFKAFMQFVEHLGGNYLATGHYTRKHTDIYGQHFLMKGLDANKDQSYFLYRLTQTQLASALFPLGHLEKPKVRRIAEAHGLITYSKKDSTGICFIGERKFKTFLQQYLPAQPGDITDETGTILGKHDGLMYHTIGQRQGLGIGGLKAYSDAPWYVAGKDLTNNRLIAVQGNDHPLLFQQSLLADQIHWISDTPPNLNTFSATAKIRYRQVDQPCTVTLNKDNTMQIIFTKPQRAVTPGQSVVLYDKDICLGGGIIQ